MSEKLIVELDLVSGSFTAELRKAGQVLSSFDAKIHQTDKSIKNIERSVTGFRAGLRDTLITLASFQTLIYQGIFYFGGFTAALLNANKELSRMNNLLYGLSDATTEMGKAIEAKSNLDYLRNFSNKAGYDIQTLTDSFVKMKSVGLDPINGALESLTNAVANFGGSKEIFHRASVAIQQMAGKGVISMEELRQQLGEAIPTALPLLARAMRMSVGELVKAISTGTVEAETALKKLFAEFERTYGGAAARQAKTLNGVINTLNNSWLVFLQRVGGAETDPNSFISTLKKQLQELIYFLNSPVGENFAKNLGQNLVTLVNGFADLVKWVYKYKEEIVLAGKAFLLYWAGSKILGIFGGIIGGLGNAGKAFSVFSNKFVSTNKYVFAFQAAIETLTMKSIPALIARIGAFAGGALVAFGPWIAAAAALATAIYGAKKAFDELSGKGAAERALSLREKLLNGETVTEQELLKFKKEKAKLQERYNRLIAEEVDLETSLKRIDETDKRKLPLSSQLDKKREEIKHVKQLLGIVDKKSRNALSMDALVGKGFNDINQSVIAKQADSLVSQVQSELERVSNAIEDQKNKIAEAAKNGYTETQKNQMDSLDRQLDQITTTTLQKNITRIRGLYNQYVAGGNTVMAQAADKAIKDLQAQLKAKLSNPNLQSTFDPNAFITPKKDGEADKEIEKLRRKYVSLATDVAEAKAKILDFNNASEQQDFIDNLIEQAENASNKLGKEGLTKALSDLKSQLIAANAEAKNKNFLDELNVKLDEAKSKADEAFESLKTLNDSPYVLAARKIQADYAETLSRIQKEPQDSKTAESKLKADELRLQRLRELNADTAKALILDNKELSVSLMSLEQQRQYTFEKEIERLKALMEMNNVSAEVIAAAQQRIILLQQKQKEEQNKVLADWARQAEDLNMNLQGAMTGWIDGFVDGLVEGEFSFKKFATSILKDLLKIIIRAYMAKAILSALGLGGFGVSVPDNRGILEALKIQLPIPDAPITKYHEGGIVKRLGNVGSFQNLQPNEVPAILKEGEGVFTQDQMQVLGKPSGVVVNVINQTSQPVDATQMEPRFDADGYVVDIILRNMDRPGPLRDRFNNG